jgi:hypothetical protein
VRKSIKPIEETNHLLMSLKNRSSPSLCELCLDILFLEALSMAVIAARGENETKKS